MNKKNIKTESGYTIIETMIAISLFIIIVMAGMGALLNANLLHQKSQNMRSIMDNLSFIMEDMSRNMRTGYNFQCFNYEDTQRTLSPATLGTPRSCANGWAVAFEFSTGNPAQTPEGYADQWAYYISDTGEIFKSTEGAAPNTFYQLTPDEVEVSSLSSFSVLGAEPLDLVGNEQQPLVTIKLLGTITFKGVVTPFSLQTSVSQRLLDI